MPAMNIQASRVHGKWAGLTAEEDRTGRRGADHTGRSRKGPGFILSAVGSTAGFQQWRA